MAACRPATIFRRRAIAGKQHTTDSGPLPGMIQCNIEFIYRLGPEGVTAFGSIDGDANRVLLSGSVISNIGETEFGNGFPQQRIENV